MSRKMKRYQGPTLPKSPALWLDAKRGKAKVIGRTITWRSHLRGEFAAKTVLAGLLLLSVVMLCGASTRGVEMSLKSVLIGYGVGGFATFLSVWYFVRPWLIRNMFSKSVTIVFTETFIKIGWKKYPREYNGSPIGIGFQIANDPDAEKKLQMDQQKIYPRLRYLLGTARMVQIVMQGTSTGGNSRQPRLVGPGQAVSIASMLGDMVADDFSAVCTTAAELTVDGPSPDQPAIGGQQTEYESEELL